MLLEIYLSTLINVWNFIIFEINISICSMNNFQIERPYVCYLIFLKYNARDSHHYIVLTLDLLTTLSRIFPCRPKTKKSNLSHLDGLSYTLRGHFD